MKNETNLKTNNKKKILIKGKVYVPREGIEPPPLSGRRSERRLSTNSNTMANHPNYTLILIL